MRKIVLLAGMIIALQLPGFGWGQIGHRAIGQLAEWHLNKRAYKKISKILAHESMAMASTWMDEIRSDSAYDYTATWHWVTIPDGEHYHKPEKEADGYAFETLQSIISALKSGSLSAREEQEQLKMLIHLVGDLHQPLHVGRGDDKGGNDIKVRWMGESTNLHSVWDSQIINSRQLSYTELAQHLNRRIHKGMLRELQAAAPAIWLEECMALRDTVYNLPKNHALSYEYGYVNYPVIERQLLMAGVRLAGILNDIYR